MGQEGDGDNESSQSEESSEEANKNSMCVSGESTTLSCNNLSSENIGASDLGDQGPDQINSDLVKGLYIVYILI